MWEAEQIYCQQKASEVSEDDSTMKELQIMGE